jgi:hypothetical protein
MSIERTTAKLYTLISILISTARHVRTETTSMLDLLRSAAWSYWVDLLLAHPRQ